MLLSENGLLKYMFIFLKRRRWKKKIILVLSINAQALIGTRLENLQKYTSLP